MSSRDTTSDESETADGRTSLNAQRPRDKADKSPSGKTREAEQNYDARHHLRPGREVTPAEIEDRLKGIPKWSRAAASERYWVPIMLQQSIDQELHHFYRGHLCPSRWDDLKANIEQLRREYLEEISAYPEVESETWKSEFEASMLRQVAAFVFGRQKGACAIKVSAAMTEELLEWAEAAARRDFEGAQSCLDTLIREHGTALAIFLSKKRVQSSNLFESLMARTIDWDEVARAKVPFNPLASSNNLLGMALDQRSLYDPIPLDPQAWKDILSLTANSSFDSDQGCEQYAGGAIKAFRIALRSYTDKLEGQHSRKKSSRAKRWSSGFRSASSKKVQFVPREDLADFLAHQVSAVKQDTATTGKGVEVSLQIVAAAVDG